MYILGRILQCKKPTAPPNLTDFEEGKVKHEILRNYVTRCQISVSGRQDLIVRGLFSRKIKGSSFCTIMYRQDMCFHCMAPSLEYIFCSWFTRKTWHEDDPHSKKWADLIQTHGTDSQIQKLLVSGIVGFASTYLHDTLYRGLLSLGWAF